jgi:endonuclease-3
MPTSQPARRLPRLLDALRQQQGPLSPPPARNAFELVVWEKVAYLASDERRAAVFAELRARVGLTPDAILAANRSTLIDILARGGMAAVERASNVIATAELIIGEFDGALDMICAGPLAEAKKQLKRIHGIADPGAEKILLLTRTHPGLGLDSNGLRVLTRLGYGTPAKSYAATYKSATTSAMAELGRDFAPLIDAHLSLRHHGQTFCKTTNPRCGACVLRAECPSSAAVRSATAR